MKDHILRVVIRAKATILKHQVHLYYFKHNQNPKYRSRNKISYETWKQT